VVLAIEKRPIPHPSGIDGVCIVIDSDGKTTLLALVGQLA
jgi:Na+-translocating ferredoxin:NAD+ oxidoreductase RnfC subunit